MHNAHPVSTYVLYTNSRDEFICFSAKSDANVFFFKLNYNKSDPRYMISEKSQTRLSPLQFSQRQRAGVCAL